MASSLTSLVTVVVKTFVQEIGKDRNGKWDRNGNGIGNRKNECASLSVKSFTKPSNWGEHHGWQ